MALLLTNLMGLLAMLELLMVTMSTGVAMDRNGIGLSCSTLTLSKLNFSCNGMGALG